MTGGDGRATDLAGVMTDRRLGRRSERSMTDVAATTTVTEIPATMPALRVIWDRGGWGRRKRNITTVE